MHDRQTISLDSLRARRGDDAAGRLFLALITGAVLLAFLMVGAVGVDVVAESWDLLSNRLWGFLTSPSSADAGRAGVSQGIRGSILIAGIVILTFPIGIGAAIYLEEYANDTWVARLIQVTVRNLAGVPSIVYGLLGLAVFVNGLQGITGGRSVIAAGLAIAVLVLPIVIITSAEAIRAVPAPLREGAYGLGATQWEVIQSQVLPAAMPGILTGTVLGIARALGEAAPLLVIGAVGFYTTGNQDFVEQLRGVLCASDEHRHVRSGAGRDLARPAAAASVVLLILVFLINLVAIIVRARISKRLGR